MGQTYTTLTGDVLDLGGLTEVERAYFDRCYAAYVDGVSWDEMANLASGSENPVVRASGGRITNEVWAHPLFQAVRDLEDRAGIRAGDLEPDPGTDPTLDPLDDDWLSTRSAAERKGVAMNAVHLAIRRGQLIAKAARPGGSWLVVSRRSLDHWTPSPVRQEAARRVRRQLANTK